MGELDVDDISRGHLNKILHKVAHALMCHRQQDGDTWRGSMAGAISPWEVARRLPWRDSKKPTRGSGPGSGDDMATVQAGDRAASGPIKCGHVVG